METQNREFSREARNITDRLRRRASKGSRVLVLVALHQPLRRRSEGKRAIVDTKLTRRRCIGLLRQLLGRRILVNDPGRRIVFLLHLAVALRVHQPTLVIVMQFGEQLLVVDPEHFFLQ